MAGRPKAGFYIVVLLVVIALVAIGLWRGGLLDVLLPTGKQETGTIDPDELAKIKGQDGAEAPDASSPTTVTPTRLSPSIGSITGSPGAVK